ncbi:MAG TPA: glycosyltransferase [Acidimicrobiales bacterium]|nr:glycosyltransferase [Acidimicrobiales bacterium]
MPQPAAGRAPATVVVCTKNRPKYLPDCLRSIDVALGADDEGIVVEDGDSAVAATLPELRGTWTHLEEHDHWKTWSMNRGIERARHDVVVFTDDEVRVPAGWIDGMVAAFDDPSVGIAFGPVEGMTHVEGPPHPYPPVGPAPAFPWEYSHGASMAVRRTAILAIGGFDERLGPGRPTGTGEEPDVILRLADAGWQCVIAPAPSVRHLEWRDDEETFRTLMNYERGSGAWMGAALRRRRRTYSKLVVARLRYQRHLFRRPRTRGWTFGARALGAFLNGVGRGLRMTPREWLRSVPEGVGDAVPPRSRDVGDGGVDQPGNH